MKRPTSPSQDCSLGVPEFPEKSCQNNWNCGVYTFYIETHKNRLAARIT